MNSPSHFESIDHNGNLFWVEWDGAEGIGFWVGNPENSTPLSIGVSCDLVEWVLDNWERGAATTDDSGQ